MRVSTENITKTVLLATFLVVVNITVFGGESGTVQLGNSDTEVATLWSKMTLRVIQNTPNGSPTYASRSLGYIGLTMYEAVVNGSTKHRSLGGQLKGLGKLPQIEKSKKYNWVLALNAAESVMLKKMYEHTSQVNLKSIDSLETAVYQSQLANTKPEVAERSAKFGVAVANVIFEWSKTDGGHQGYLRNFDSTYQYPKGRGFWKAPPKGQSPVPLPLHPYWEKTGRSLH